MSFHEKVLDESCYETSVTETPLDSRTSEDDGDFFGPALPPHLLKRRFSRSSEKEAVYGPILPDYSKEKEKSKSDEVSFSILEEKTNVLIGPLMPDHQKSKLVPSEALEKVSTLTNGEEDSFGPPTALMASGDATSYYKLLIARNLHKNTDCVNESSIKRESWMLELPEKKTSNFGLLPRHFKSQIQTDKESDDSVWTDTPADKVIKKNNLQKKDYKEIEKKKRLEERDKEMERLAKKATKKLRKKESLLEMHLKTMKKQKKNESKKHKKEFKLLPERRPFDRNLDLQIRQIDETQKKLILNKSQFLNDRFSAGQSKYL